MIAQGASVSQAEEMERIFAGRATPALIGNLVTTVTTRRVGQTTLPVTINDRSQSPTCYLCCPTVAYIDYAREELRHLAESRALKRALDGLLRLAAPLMRATGFDHQVQPNNWLLATNICGAVDAVDIREMTQALCATHPEMAIVWRSLNDVSDADAIEIFRNCGYHLYPARQVYLFDCRQQPLKQHRDETRDMQLLAQPDFTVVEPQDIRPGDFERIELLYKRLYLDKYTDLNPQYSATWLQQMHAAGILNFHGLRNRDGRLDGIAGFFDRGEVMTAPVVGYDTAIDMRAGLYRRLMAIALARARQRRLLFNMSAGAAGFKRNRGAIPAIEYSAIYHRHLPWTNRVAAAIVRLILQKTGIPIMRAYRL